METKSSVRAMDDLGRFVIPGDIREKLAWGAGTRLEVSVNDLDNRSIIIRETSPCCSLCREEYKDLIEVEKGYICRACAGKIK